MNKLSGFAFASAQKGANWARDRRGSTIVTFGLSALAVVLAVGAAIDITIIINARQHLQDAADSAVLHAVALPSGSSDAVRQGQADKIFNSNFSDKSVTVQSKVLTNLSDSSTVQLQYDVTGSVAGYFSGLIGKKGYTVSVRADALSRLQKSEIALVLDSTGSMSLNNKMTNLKTSVDSVLASLVDTSGNNVSGTKVAVVPFNTQVRIAPGSALTDVDYGTEAPYEACTGISSYVCTVAWDVVDKICAGASNMNTCRSTIKGWYATSTSNGKTYYTITYHAYENTGGGYKIYNYAEAYYTSTQTVTTAPYSYTDETGTHYNPGGTYSSTSFTYSTQGGNAWTGADLSTYAAAPAGAQTAIASSALYYAVSNSNGYGAYSGGTSNSTSNGVKRTYVYPSMGDTKTSWTGCVIDRTQPYDVQGDAPNAAIAATLYPARPCAYTTLQPVQGLNDNISSVRSFVKTLQPGGDTNITIGVQWGMEVLSPTAPFTGGVNFKDDVTHKYMILVTDGANTANRWSKTQSAVDARTALACKNAKALGITIFVINVVDGSSDLLSNCASRPDYFYNLSNSSQINTALSNVFEAIKKTRLSG